jgi:ArsR family transcriptional regulator
MSQPIHVISDQLKLLGDKSRLTMLLLLRERDLCVCEIVDIMDMSQPGISQHLRKMKDAGLLNETRKGQWIYYSLNLEDKPYIQDILKHIPSQKELFNKITSTCGSGVKL